MNLNPEQTAHILIEFQIDFTSEGGVFHAAVKPVMNSTNMLANAIETAQEAQAAGVQVVHVPISFTENYHELTAKPYGILKGVVDNDAFKKNIWGSQLVEPLTPEPQDIIIEGKRGLCGFASTNLDFVLRSKGIKNVAIAGFLTNCCVESTMRAAYEHGYNVITLTDCCATLSQEEHDNALQKDFPMFGQPMAHSDFLNLVENKEELNLIGKAYE